ncbi:hypothetical protein [Dyadobacter fermentans]|uniref:hypothetical protein n=1 Tax=Dyadobacter fermentans TaxID=94254 RepID=UPI001CBF0EA4|nr:hypothetical protein [Dyadobacter fermentans]MBZ1362161.1 hypothetical protein [Dyadobacter fermentans]
MRKSTDIKREIFDLANFQVKLKPEDKEFKQNKKRIEYLNECVLYLETSPTEEFLEREVKRLEANIVYIDKQFDKWLSRQHFSAQAPHQRQKSKKTFEKESGIPKLRQQLKTIEFLLNK